MDALPVVTDPAPPALPWLRGLPLIGRFAPRPRAIRWGILADYTIRIRALDCAGGVASHCYQAVLLDADPGLP
jgi:hypothetical protein